MTQNQTSDMERRRGRSISKMEKKPSPKFILLDKILKGMCIERLDQLIMDYEHHKLLSMYALQHYDSLCEKIVTMRRLAFNRANIYPNTKTI